MNMVRITYTVLMISSALVLGLVVAAPAALPVAGVAAAQSGGSFTAPVEADAAQVAEGVVIATLIAKPPVVAGLATTFQDTAKTAAAAPRMTGKSKRIRQSMAMPFFSFAPRG